MHFELESVFSSSDKWIPWDFSFQFSMKSILQIRCKKYFKKHESSQILSRKERFFEFEEIKQGNLERECFEENCNDEERLEVFDNHQKDYKVKMIFEVCIKQRIRF